MSESAQHDPRTPRSEKSDADVSLKLPEMLLCEAVEEFTLGHTWELIARTEQDLGTFMVDAWSTPVRIGSALASGTMSVRDDNCLSVARYYRIQQGHIALGIDCGSVGIEIVDVGTSHPTGGLRVLRAHLFTQNIKVKEANLSQIFSLCDHIVGFFEDIADRTGVTRSEFLTFDPRMARVLAHRGYKLKGSPIPGVEISPSHASQRMEDLHSSGTVLPYNDHWTGVRRRQSS